MPFALYSSTLTPRLCRECLYYPLFFFFNDTATTEIYTLSLHDALPISCGSPIGARIGSRSSTAEVQRRAPAPLDRKSTRLNSSHSQISYAVFCLKKKKNPDTTNFLPRGDTRPGRLRTRYLLA